MQGGQPTPPAKSVVYAVLRMQFYVCEYANSAQKINTQLLCLLVLVLGSPRCPISFETRSRSAQDPLCPAHTLKTEFDFAVFAKISSEGVAERTFRRYF